MASSRHTVGLSYSCLPTTILRYTVVCGEKHAGTRSRDGLWKPTRPTLQADTDPRVGVDLDSGFPETLALLSHMGIKETGSRILPGEGHSPPLPPPPLP